MMLIPMKNQFFSRPSKMLNLLSRRRLLPETVRQVSLSGCVAQYLLPLVENLHPHKGVEDQGLDLVGRHIRIVGGENTGRAEIDQERDK